MTNELEISDDFTIEDIHKIRKYHYELRKEIGDVEYEKQVAVIVEEFLKDHPNAKVVEC
jgi:hypothetical protein